MEDRDYISKCHIKDKHLMKLIGIEVQFVESDLQDRCMCYLKLKLRTKDDVIRTVSAGIRDKGQDLYVYNCEKNDYIMEFTLFHSDNQYRGLKISTIWSPKEHEGDISDSEDLKRS